MSTVAQENLDLVPEIVRRKAAEMEAFIKGETAAMTEGAPAGETEPDQAPEPAKTTAVETPAKPQALETKVSEPPAEPSASQKAVPTTFAEVATEEMTKEQRYKIMEGIQKAAGRDLSRAQREAQALRDENDALKRQLEASPRQVTAQGQTQPTPAQPTGASSERRAKLAEVLGSETLSDLLAEAKEELRKEGFVTGSDLKKVQEEVGTVSRSVAQSATEQFHTEMERLVPGWLSINNDPKFIEWMSEEDGYTGIARKDAAQRFVDKLDAPRLARYFADYTGQPVTDGGQGQPPKLDKKRLASPRATPGAQTVLDNEPAKVKMSEFKQFASDVRAGKYQDFNNPERHKQLQAKMFAEQERLDNAQRLGHVIQG